ELAARIARLGLGRVALLLVAGGRRRGLGGGLGRGLAATARGQRGEENEEGEALLQGDLDDEAGRRALAARGETATRWAGVTKKGPGVAGASLRSGAAGDAAIAHFLESSSSITDLNASKGCAPETRRPLMKNAGVPMR